ncbi:chymotrypsinogen A-like [Cheilinus undulatus]|uniref:chymotrypsinogen A-like n=1 Tax=Cheilinus undulatus TaxID=241271 RepID=UPI001BD699BF|nr:chymotrypsinogen A-like [Cheilinus undulatus]
MALYKILCSVTLMLLFTPNGGHAVMPECGKMVDGHPDHLPWQAIITIDGRIRCLGSLINQQWVLTDGHCGAGHFLHASVSLGRMDMSDPENNCEEMREVDYFTCNEPTSNSLITRDSMCLLRMATPVNFTDFIFPVCIASGDSNIHSGTESWVATGSYTNPLMKVPLVGYNTCKCSIPKLKDHMICAGKLDHHWLDDECLVNLGGGLLVNYNGYWTLIGVVRLDPTCSELDALKTYSDVSPCQEFLSNITDEHNRPTFVSVKSIGTDPDVNFVCLPPNPPEPPMPPKPQPPCTDPPAPPCPKPEGGCRDDSVFDSGVSMMPSSPFVLLFVLVLSLCGVYW